MVRPVKPIVKTSSTRSDWKWRMWRICWLLAAGWIFLKGAIVRFAAPGWPLIAPDSFIYLGPSINGGHYDIGPRMFVYPMFCRILLQVTHDWRSIAIAQHLLGLLGPALLLLAWVSLGARIWSSRLARAAHEAIGLALPLLLALSAPYVAYEQQVLLESFNAFLQCCLGALLCLLWASPLPAKRMRIACCTAGFGVFMYYGNPRWGAAAIMVLAIAVLAVINRRESIRQWVGVAWPVFAAFVTVYAGLGLIQFRLVPHDGWNDSFTAKVLLWMHADLAVNEFRRDLAAPMPPDHAELLRKIIPKIEKEIVGRYVSHWNTLTFNANALLYVPDNPDGDLVIAFHNDPEGYKRFCLHYYFAILLHQPKAYFKEVWFLLHYYYAGPQDDGAFREFAQAVTLYFPASASLLRVLAQSAAPAPRALLEAAAKAMDRPVNPPVVFWPPPWLDALVRLIHVWFMPISLAGVAGASAVLLWPRLQVRRELAVLAWLCLGSAGVLFVQVLTLALVTVTEGRYDDALRTLAVFSLICASTMIASLAIALVASLKSVRTPTA